MAIGVRFWVGMRVRKRAGVMGYGLWVGVSVRVRVRLGVRVSSPPDLASSFFALTWLGLGLG